MKCFGREHKSLEKLGVTLLAISTDDQDSHRRFAASLGLEFPLLTDTEAKVARQYGVFTHTPGGGFAARSVFLIDGEGILRFVERDFGVPRTLEGSDLLAACEALEAGEPDPASAFAALPSPEKEGKTLLVRYVQAVLAEDARGLSRLLHTDFGSREGEPRSKVRERRNEWLNGWRSLFGEHDVSAVKFADAVQLDSLRVIDAAAAQKLRPGDVGSVAREAAAQLGKDELVLRCRTAQPKVGDRELFPRELVLLARKKGSTWSIAAVPSQ